MTALVCALALAEATFLGLLSNALCVSFGDRLVVNGGVGHIAVSAMRWIAWEMVSKVRDPRSNYGFQTVPARRLPEGYGLLQQLAYKGL